MKKLLFVLMFLVFPVQAQEIEGWPETIEEEIHLLFTKECIGELARLHSRFSGRTQEDEFDFCILN